MIINKTPEEVDKVAASGTILARCLQMLRAKARAGVTTGELDEAAERFIRSQGAEPAFKGYRGFPGSICASPNSMIVHGIPGRYKLQRGDILSLDVGVVLDGWVSDAAVTVPIGPVSPIATRLMQTTREALFQAVEQVRPGNHLGDVSNAVQRKVEGDGFSVVRSLVGHGIGREMHEDPQIPRPADPQPRRSRNRPRPRRGHGPGDRADDHGRRGRHPRRVGQLVGLLVRRVARVPLRAHGGGDRRRAPNPHSVAPGRGPASGLTPATFECPAGSRFLGCRAAPLHESTSFSQTDVREVQGHPPARRDLGDLSEPAA
jgi:methionyl aminopeptidase